MADIDKKALLEALKVHLQAELERGRKRAKDAAEAASSDATRRAAAICSLIQRAPVGSNTGPVCAQEAAFSRATAEAARR